MSIIGGNVETQVNFVRYLGVSIDSVLSCNLHIHTIASKIRFRLASIYRYMAPAVYYMCILYIDATL